MNPFANDPLDGCDSRSADGGIGASNNMPSGVGNSVFRRMLWSHYSSSLHFFGGSIFPNTTTSTTSLYNSNPSTSHRCDRVLADGGQKECKKVAYLSCSDTLSYPRPTNQLLKLIRRRRGTVNATVTPPGVAARAPTTTEFTGSNDDSWNAVRYHIVSRPTDCRYVCYSSNLSTPLHAACLFRAPHDVILMLLTAWPAATLHQDAEGWTPLHVHILYNTTPASSTANGGEHSSDSRNNHSIVTATTSLIRIGGAQAAAQHSKFVGSPLHLACRHNVPLAILAELLQVCPEQVSIPNEAGGLPANLLWKSLWKERIRKYEESIKTFSSVRRPDRKRILEQQEWKRIEYEYDTELVIRLNLLLGAFLNAPILLEFAQRIEDPIFGLHDVVRFQYEFATQGDFVNLYLKFYPTAASDHEPTTQALPLHVAASYHVDESVFPSIPLDPVYSSAVLPVEDNEDQLMASSSLDHHDRFSWPPTSFTSSRAASVNAFRTSSVGSGSPAENLSDARIFSQHLQHPKIQDPLESVLRSYPFGAYVKKNDRKQRTALHIALIEGKRTWRTGIQCLVAAAPETVEWKEFSTQLYPYQLAAVADENFGSNKNSNGRTSLHINGKIDTINTKDCNDVSDKGNTQKDLIQLETIYCLLLACPHVISESMGQQR